MNGGHFKLGLFVIVAVVLLVTMLLLLGVLQSFKPTITFETYFAENIQGLRPGAAVRYRGVDVGVVGHVGFAATEYPEARGGGPEVFGTQVLVELVIDESALASLNVTDAAREVGLAVDRGLRARLSSAGLGGPTFIELNYLDPVRFPAAAIAWTPNDIRVPSAPSQITSVLGALEAILIDVERSDLVDNLAGLATIGAELQRLVTRLDESEILATAGASLDELRAASADIRELLADERIGTLLDDASTTLVSVRTVVDEVTARDLINELTIMADGLESAAGTLDGLGRTVEQSDLVTKLQDMAGDLGPAGRDLSELAARLERLVGANDTRIADTIQSLRRASLQIEALLEEAQANPSRMIFGDPPPRRTPGGSP